MEPKPREDSHAPSRPEPVCAGSSDREIALTLPFASEGLESVRDSHC